MLSYYAVYDLQGQKIERLFFYYLEWDALLSKHPRHAPAERDFPLYRYLIFSRKCTRLGKKLTFNPL